VTTDTPFSNRPGADQGAYITGLLELLGDRDPLAVLAATPGEVRRSLEGVPEDELRRPEAPGKWSRLQVAAHLADSEVAIAWRLRLTIAQDRPPLTGYDQDAWAERLGYAGEVLQSPTLMPDAAPVGLWEEARALAPTAAAVLLVAHEPLLSTAVSWMLGETRVVLGFGPGTLVRIDFEVLGPQPRGVFKWKLEAGV